MGEMSALKTKKTVCTGPIHLLLVASNRARVTWFSGRMTFSRAADQLLYCIFLKHGLIFNHCDHLKVILLAWIYQFNLIKDTACLGNETVITRIPFLIVDFTGLPWVCNCPAFSNSAI